MVQLITELERRFSVEFDLEEIHRLRSYTEIRETLFRKGLVLCSTAGLEYRSELIFSCALELPYMKAVCNWRGTSVYPKGRSVNRSVNDQFGAFILKHV